MGDAVHGELDIDRLRCAKHRLPHPADGWLLSGYATTDSRILRIPTKNFINLLVAPKLENGRRPFDSFFTNESFTTGVFVKRCQDELAIRQAEYLETVALIAREEYDRVLALYAYEYQESSGDREWNCSRDKLAWLVGLPSGSAVKDYTDFLEDSGAMQRRGETSSVFDLRPEKLRKYYVTIKRGD